jgi:hypothetical protein
MLQPVLIAATVTLWLGGCERSESVRLRAEVARLHDENDRLNAEAKRLLLEIDALKTAADEAKSDEDRADDDGEVASDEPLVQASNALLTAQSLYVHGDYRRAAEVARQAIAGDPQRAWRLIVASRCHLHDRQATRAAFQQLDPDGRALARSLCAPNQRL